MSNVLALNGEIAPAPTVGALQRGVLRRPVELTDPYRTFSASFDHRVGDREHSRWNGEAEGLRGLEVDGELEFGRL